MVVITPAADGVPPRVEEEIIVLLFLALKRRAAEEKKARVVVGVVIFVSKDDAFGGDVVSAGDGADERRSPTALCISLFLFVSKNCRFFLYRNFFRKRTTVSHEKNHHFSHPLSSLRGVLLINTHTRTHKTRARFCRQRVLLSLRVCLAKTRLFVAFSSQK